MSLTCKTKKKKARIVKVIYNSTLHLEEFLFLPPFHLYFISLHLSHQFPNIFFLSICFSPLFFISSFVSLSSLEYCQSKPTYHLTHWALDHIKMWSGTINSWLGFLKILNYVPKEREKYILQKMSPHLSVKCCNGS